MMTEKEWEEATAKIREKIASGEIKDESWEDFLHYYVDYDCGISHEFQWDYKGISYGLYPIEDFGKYEFLKEGSNESIIYDDIFDALEKVRFDGKSLRELYEQNIIFFEIT